MDRPPQDPTELGKIESRVLARARAAEADSRVTIAEAISLQVDRGDQEAVLLQGRR